ncbi:MAG TPA: zinc-binding alcohol dehydrogenase [Steroidobacteraceae bacterium]|nr:zinc-binding alcohol dehydrogenase [Steroidobacteraceae bacterium]
MDHARAFWITDCGASEIRSEPLPAVREGEVLVHALYSGISRGTESLVYLGGVPASEWQRMRAPHQAGDFPAPVKYGYASVGCVETGPQALGGRNVFCLYPHQDRYVVQADAVFVLPDGVPPRRAVLAANLETAINGIWDGRISVGDSVAVVGAGTVGCLVAWLAAQIPGTTVELIDIDPRKASVAAALSVGFAAPEHAQPDADVVIHTSAAAEGLATALRLAAFEGTVVEMSWYGSRQVRVPLGEAFHSRRLTLRSSQVGEVAADRRARFTRARRLELALRLLCDDRLDVLLSGEDPFEALPAVMARLATAPEGALCHVIRYD